MDTCTRSTDETPIEQPPLLKGKELAAALNVSNSLITKWTKAGCPVVYMGDIVGTKRGACPRYRLSQVMAWLKQRNEKEVQV